MRQKVKFSFLSSLSDITIKDEIDLPIETNWTVKNALEKLISQFGKEFEKRIYNPSEGLNSYIIITLNGKDIRNYNDLETQIKNGDELSFLPLIAGG